MRYLLLLVSLSFTIPNLVLANGSPIDGSDIKATGNIHMMQKAEISLDKEELQVLLEGDYAVVHTEYHLTNHGKRVKVTYGFPVDHVPPEERDFDDELRGTWKTLQDVVIKADGKALETKEFQDADENRIEERLPSSIRTWVVTDLDFGEAERSVVTVSYRVKNFFNDWIYSKSFIPNLSYRTFAYALSPSGNWGNGIVSKVSISIDTSKIKAKGGFIRKIVPDGHTDSNGIIRWEFDDVDLKKARDLEVVYDDSVRVMSDFVAKERLPVRLVRQTEGLSSLKDGVDRGRDTSSQVLDDNLDTAWCGEAGSDGTFKPLTFELEGAVVRGIGIINGDTKSRESYEDNCRVKKIKVIAVQKNDVEWQGVVDLPERDVEKMNRDAVASFIDWVADFGDPFETTQRVSLVIAEVYPGRKPQKACISEVYILGFLPQQ